MNQKQFEVWKAQKQREYEIELENFRNNMAERGLAQSGMRLKGEVDLRAKYDSEIEIQRLAVEERSVGEPENIESKIENLYRERDQKIADIKANPDLHTRLAERRIDVIRGEYELKIAPLERRRKYIAENRSAVRADEFSDQKQSPSVTISNSNVHFGTGDNVGSNKILRSLKDVPLWLRYAAAFATVLGAVFAIYTYFYSSFYETADKDGSSIVVTGALNIADILSEYNSKKTSLEKQNFLQPYSGAKIQGSGSFIDIGKSSGGYLVTFLVSNNLVSCYFSGDQETERRLFLLRKDQSVTFSGIFRGSVVFGGGWSVGDCALLN